MKKSAWILVLLAGLTLAGRGIAQENSKAEGAPPTTVRVQVVLTETASDKKVVNLPYTFYLKAATSHQYSPYNKIRIGSRVPIAGSYTDIGTNIDAQAVRGDDGHFDVSVNLERSRIESAEEAGKEDAASLPSGRTAANEHPILYQFKVEQTIPMKDGQTVQLVQATDALSGRVLTVTVTINVVK